MPFEVVIPNQHTSETSQGGWQLRISIDPSVLKEESKKPREYKESKASRTPQVTIEIIKSILIHQLSSYDVQVKIWKITHKEDYLEHYDGTTSHQGKDTTERGKEICITFPDARHCAITAEKCKEILLKLWRAFQDNKIPLVFMDVPGDKKILGPDHLVTPFSLTSLPPPRQTPAWETSDGQLHRQFIPYENNHPLLNLELSPQDLQRHDIVFPTSHNFKNNCAYFYMRQREANMVLRKDLQAIESLAQDYGVLLHNDVLVRRIQHMLRDYYNHMPVERAQHAAYQQAFHSKMMQDVEFQFLLNAYPREGSQLAHHSMIMRLRNLNSLTEAEVESCIKILRSDYTKTQEKIFKDIKARFTALGPGQERHKAKGTEFEATPMDWAAYIPKYTLQRLEALIRKNPAGMQIIYRRIVLLERDRRSHMALEHHQLEILHPRDEALVDASVPPITVLDIDHTLIMGLNPFHNTVFNEHLIQALLKKGIREVYLCTDIVFGRNAVLERMALIDALEHKGIRVLAIATPADYLWDATEQQLQPFFNASGQLDLSQQEKYLEQKESSSLASLPWSKSKVGHAFKEAQEVYKNDYEAYKAYRLRTSPKKDLIAGIGDYLLKSSEYKHVQGPIHDRLLQKSKNCRALTKSYCIESKISHIKGLMFEATLQHTQAHSFLFFDDKPEAIKAVESCRKKYKGSKKISTQIVNKNNTDSVAQYKTMIDYHNRIEPLAQNIDIFLTRWSSKLPNAPLQHLKQDLRSLHNVLAKDINKKTKNGKSILKKISCNALNIADKTCYMLREIDEVIFHPIAEESWKRAQVQKIIKNYRKQSTELSTSKKMLKILSIAAVTLLGFALGALAGAGIGIAAGAWSGVGAILTGTMGLFLGAAQGASVGLAVGASATGLASGMVAYGLFGRYPLHAKVRADMNQLAKSADALFTKEPLIASPSRL